MAGWLTCAGLQRGQVADRDMCRQGVKNGLAIICKSHTCKRSRSLQPSAPAAGPVGSPHRGGVKLLLRALDADLEQVVPQNLTRLLEELSGCGNLLHKRLCPSMVCQMLS